MESIRKKRRSIKAGQITVIRGVVKGTLIFAPQPPDLGGLNEISQSPSNTRQALLPPEVSREAHLLCGIEKDSSPERAIYARPIDSIQPGDLVLGYDGQPHRVLSIHTRRYHGPMIAIRHDQSDQALTLTADYLVLTQRRVQQITPNSNWSGIPPDHFTYARTLRKEATPPERVLWRFLRNEQLGVKFRRQHPIGPYIADFYTRDADLVVEVDGAASHGSTDQAAYDAERDRFMQNLGLTVLRFPAREVFHQTQSVVSLILTTTRERVLTEDIHKQWRYAKNIKAGDTIYMGAELFACEVTAVTGFESEQDVIDLEVEDFSARMPTP